MIKVLLKRNRVIIESEKDASTIRNKGYVVRRNKGEYSLDLVTAFHLLAKRRLLLQNGASVVDTQTLLNTMNKGQRDRSMAFHFLRDKGLRPTIGRNNLILDGRKIRIFGDGENLNFSAILGKSSYIAVIDREGEGLLYSVERLKLLKQNDKRSVEPIKTFSDQFTIFLQKHGLRPESGLKYGCQYRVYDSLSPHAKYLVSTADNEFGVILGRDLVSNVRIANSVRKTFVHAVKIKATEKYQLLAFKWIKL